MVYVPLPIRIKHASWNAWRTLRNGALTLAMIVLGILVVRQIESLLFPVLRNIVTSNVAVNGDKICWDWSWDKTSNSLASFVVAKLYVDDEPLPVFVGLRHKTGRAFTGQQVIGHIDTSGCVKIPVGIRANTRYGIQPVVQYFGWHGLWVVNQPMPWIDAYVLPP